MVLLHAAKLGHGTDSFTSPPEDFYARKIQRLRLGLNPQTWVPEASMLTTRPPKPSSTLPRKWLNVFFFFYYFVCLRRKHTYGYVAGHSLSAIYGLRVPDLEDFFLRIYSHIRQKLIPKLGHFTLSTLKYVHLACLAYFST